MDTLNLHPIITPLFIIWNVLYISSYWQKSREGHLLFKAAANFFVITAMAMSDLWTGAAVSSVSFVSKLLAIYGYKRFSTPTKILVVFAAFAAALYLQGIPPRVLDALPLAAFLYGRIVGQFVSNQYIRVASLPVQGFYMAYFASAGRLDALILESINLVANIYTWKTRRHLLDD
ncbi:MAG: YgjV family protein [Alphaproteobacteria bacterium]